MSGEPTVMQLPYPYYYRDGDLPRPFNHESRGLPCLIYRHADTDCTNGGVTSPKYGLSEVLLVGEGINGVFTIGEGMRLRRPALRLVRRKLLNQNDGTEYEYLHAEPFQAEGRSIVFMFGGNFIHSSDSRFPSRYPIPVHDRLE